MTTFHKIFATMLLASALTLPFGAAQASTYTVLHHFTGGADGSDPAPTLRISNNVIVGTASHGGQYGVGTLYSLNPVTTGFTLLHAFSGGADGAFPSGNLATDSSGYVFGTTALGASNNGTVFVFVAGYEAVMHAFSGPDGSGPVGVIQVSGNSYGTTNAGGGGDSCGTAYEITSSGQFSVLHTFQYADACSPDGALWMDRTHNLYGAAQLGGTGYGGAVFKIASNGTETALYSFCSVLNCPDGEEPVGDLTGDASGNVYGVTERGGAYNFGTVFRVASGGSEAVLHSFTGGSDGATPLAGLYRDASGNLFGTTYDGGTYGHGVVFELSGHGVLTVLHAFNGNDGDRPLGTLAASGTVLYGTTSQGGAFGDGVLFSVTP